MIKQDKIALDWRDTVKQLADRRLLSVFYLGCLSGFPWVLIGSVMSLWLKEAGMSRTTIGYFGAVGIAYALNFLWAPLMDRVALPGWLGKLGLRRSWLVVLLSAMAIFSFLLGFLDPTQNLGLVGLLVLGVAIASATQDLVIDAYRIERFAQSETHMLSNAAAAATAGWWAGYGFIGGFFALYLGGETIGIAWPVVYQILALLLLVQVAVIVLFVSEPQSDRFAEQAELEKLYEAKLHTNKMVNRFLVTVVEPLLEFFRRCGWQIAVGLIVFVLTFKLGEAFLGRMSIVFYKEVGFTTDQIGLYSKFAGGLATAIFAVVGAMIVTHYGVIRGLIIGGISMASSNILFAVIAQLGPIPELLGVAIVVDSFTGAFATVAFIAFISSFTSRTYTATQYALLASLGNLGRTTLASSSGQLVDWLGGNWTVFFVLTAIAVIPSLLVLAWLNGLLNRRSLSEPIRE